MDLVKVDTLLNVFEKCRNLFLWVVKNKAKFKKEPYYFKDYHKHVTIYENGNGILINSFSIVFNRADDNEIRRGINISDGKISAKFPSFKKMQGESLENRFDKYGFWVYSDDNIIEESKEEYWVIEGIQENITASKNDKELRWVLKFNPSKIELHKPYRVIYIISIPGMFPITKGKLDFSEIENSYFFGYSSSSIDIRTPIEEIYYTVSFYNSIDLQTEPEATVHAMVGRDNSPLKINKEYNIIYNKYICHVEKPQLGSKIIIKWKFIGGESND
ncbi:MAG: hypothetical protein NC094_07025 [Bacteroidales bacterium]|nr:hypothetical protein [Lachnoclostridium sp.]MCM1384563.1 hypothetical protein [Lachnoclostridium sp.]MCM1465155.1 hypothetical protein [Bacteroidales bacterium]